MWAAIRYRRAQALALMAVSAMITACAAFAPLYERALEESLLRDGLTRQSATATAIVAEAVQARDVVPSTQKIRSTFPAALTEVYDGGSDLWTGGVAFTGVAGSPSTIDVYGPQDTCRGLSVVQGSCPAKPFDIAVSSAEASVQGWSIGTRLEAREDVLPGTPGAGQLPQPFVVTAFYRQLDDPGHWQGVTLEGRAGRVLPGPSGAPLMDAWVTPTATFQGGWKADRLGVTWLLNRNAVTLDTIDAVGPAVDSMRASGLVLVPTVTTRTAVSDLVASVVEGQRQARVIVPLLLGQLAVLAVVVLGLVAAAAVEQRRPELALSRLRGRGPTGTTRLVLFELGCVVLAGVPVGFVLALLVEEVARRAWLTEGVPFELPSASVVAALVSGGVALLALAVVARPTLREPISTLLRRVPPRRSGWAVGVVDAVVVTVATAGLVTLLSGNLSGPLALATPTLIALGLGLVLAHVLVPVADLVGRRLTSRGRLVGGLTAVHVARRPAVRRILAILTVATALTVFATDALVVGARNRDERARVETGAEAVLTTSARDVTTLVRAVAAAGPAAVTATPVVKVRQGSSTAMTTLAVVPDQFARIAELPRQADQFAWQQIAKPPPPDVLLTGRSLSVTVSDITVTQTVFNGFSAQPWTVRAFLAPVGSRPFAVPLGDVTPGSAAPLTLHRDVSCESGCRLTGFGVTTPAMFAALLKGRFVVGPVSMDGSPPAGLGGASSWLPSGFPDAPPEQMQSFAKAAGTSDPTRLSVEFQTKGDDVQITASGSGAAIPALVVGSLPSDAPGPAFQAAGLDGLAVDMTRVAQVPYAPGGADSEAMVNLDTLARSATQISALGVGQVWMSDASAVPAMRSSLASSGLSVLAVDLRSDRKALFDSSAAAWGLQLALVVGLVALAIAAVVMFLVAATSWRSRAGDYAALRMAGVDARTLRRVAVAEQWAVVLVSVVVGAVSGVLGAQLAMPILPFFSNPSAVFPVDTSAAVVQVAACAITVLGALLIVGAVVGARLAGRASLSRVRESI